MAVLAGWTALALSLAWPFVLGVVLRQWGLVPAWSQAWLAWVSRPLAAVLCGAVCRFVPLRLVAPLADACGLGALSAVPR